MSSQNQSCGSLPCKSSLSNTTRVTKVGGFTIKYGGEGGPNDYDTRSTYFHDTLLPTANNWAKNLDYYARNYGRGGIAWIGHIGTTTNTRCSYHRHAKGWDLNHIRFNNGTYLDFVRRGESWESSSRAERRLYLAVDASLQRYFNACIDAYSHPRDHHNHIHVDRSCGNVATPYTPWGSYSDDTKFIQHCITNFTSTSISHDGYWGNNTQTGWNRLLGYLDMKCVNPLTSVSSWKMYLSYIVRHGLKNRSAGTYRYVCRNIQ